jgi:hypothetical protein
MKPLKRDPSADLECAAMHLLVVAEAFSEARRRAKAPVTTEWHVERELRKAAMAYGDQVRKKAP